MAEEEVHDVPMPDMMVTSVSEAPYRSEGAAAAASCDSAELPAAVLICASSSSSPARRTKAALSGADIFWVAGLLPVKKLREGQGAGARS